MSIVRKLGMILLLIPISGSIAGEIDLQRSGTPSVVAIGGVPKTMSSFRTTDCESQQVILDDCSAIDSFGREYIFFDGVLTKIAAVRMSSKRSLQLPAGVKFGERIKISVRKIEAEFKVRLHRGIEQPACYASDFVFTSSVGTSYGVELCAIGGRLNELILRSNSP